MRFPYLLQKVIDKVCTLLEIKSVLSFVHLLFVCGIYFGFVFIPVLSSDFYLPRDNLVFQLYNFSYFANSFKYTHALPTWYPIAGGSPVGVASLAWASMLPHRLLGYFLYCFLPLDIVTAYKITLTIGITLFAIGWWIFLWSNFRSRFSATYATLLLILTGTGTTVLHQEHVIGTTFWVPWILIALKGIRKNYLFILLAAVFAGIACTTCYPHYLILSFLFLVVPLLCLGRLSWLVNKQTWDTGKLPLTALALALFFACALPLLYIQGEQKKFISPARGAVDIDAASYSDYMRMNLQNRTCPPIESFSQYVMPTDKRPDDDFVFFITYGGLLLAILGVLLNFRKAAPVFITLILSIWAVAGVNGYLPQLLFLSHFPFISQFRQWYHFFPFPNLCLSFLAGMGVLTLMNYFRCKGRIWLTLFCTLVLTILLFESHRYYSLYFNTHIRLMDGAIRSPGRWSNEEFESMLRTDWTYWLKARELKSDWQRWIGDTLVHLTYRERYSLMRHCPSLFRGPYSIPAKPAYTIKPASDYRLFVLSEGNDLRCSSLEKNLVDLNPQSFQVTPQGFNLKGYLKEPALIILPYSYRLKPVLTANDEPVKAMPFLGGAMTMVSLPSGSFHLRANIPFSFYHYAVLVQWSLLICVLCIVLLKQKASTRTPCLSRGSE
ncbi:MAG: hypothetical protein HY537_02840 [Deltaproteobacteria bacterium]|nr:hypothetical protein [Deltaproteobacteria bacterium]